MEYLGRLQEGRLTHVLKQFPVVCLTGPRQAGKSTLLKHVAKPEWSSLNLDQRGVVERALQDPDLFIRNLKTPAVIDEAQKAPPLFHSIKAMVDEDAKKKFILSGSANFHLMENITETLAGRAAILELFPFSMSEVLGIAAPRFFTHLVKTRDFKKFLDLVHGLKVGRLDKLYSHILWGGMPKIREYESAEEKVLWFENYRTTYIERDLRNLAQVGHLEEFQKFYQALAFQTANLLNLSAFSQEIGVSVPTLARYLDILRTSYQAVVLPPYHASLRKRLVKTPKVYLADTGLACFFLKYDTEEMLLNGGRLGALFETWALMEIKKLAATLPSPPAFFFWKPHAGYEVDLILESGEYLYPMEIKHAMRLRDEDWRGISDLMKDINKRIIPFGIVWYRGEQVQTVAPKIIALPLAYLWH